MNGFPLVLILAIATFVLAVVAANALTYVGASTGWGWLVGIVLAIGFLLLAMGCIRASEKFDK